MRRLDLKLAAFKLAGSRHLTSHPGLVWLAAQTCAPPSNSRHARPILVADSHKSYEQYIAMTRLNVSKAREAFPEVVNRAAYGKERIIVSRRGKDLGRRHFHG
jgi:hypothetical protein